MAWNLGWLGWLLDTLFDYGSKWLKDLTICSIWGETNMPQRASGWCSVNCTWLVHANASSVYSPPLPMLSQWSFHVNLLSLAESWRPKDTTFIWDSQKTAAICTIPKSSPSSVGVHQSLGSLSTQCGTICSSDSSYLVPANLKQLLTYILYTYIYDSKWLLGFVQE